MAWFFAVVTDLRLHTVRTNFENWISLMVFGSWFHPLRLFDKGALLACLRVRLSMNREYCEVTSQRPNCQPAPLWVLPITLTNSKFSNSSIWWYWPLFVSTILHFCAVLTDHENWRISLNLSNICWYAHNLLELIDPKWYLPMVTYS